MSSFILKILALFFMIIDHIGFVLFPNIRLFRIIGRLAFPLFAYQMAVGFSHTRNKKNHIIKLLLFAIICQIPYCFMLNVHHIDLSFNILFTFVIALLMIYLFEHLFHKDFWEEKKTNFLKKFLICFTFFFIATGLFVLACSLPVDYTWYGILLTIGFYFTLNSKSLSILVFFILVNLNYFLKPSSIMNLYAYISLLDIIFILAFNGKQGYKHPWLFYVLYFLHFLPLLLLKYFA